MSPKSAWKLVELDMRGYETELTESFITIRHPDAEQCSFFQAGSDDDELVEAAWAFAEKLDAYVLDAPACHHPTIREGVRTWASRTFLARLFPSLRPPRA